MIRVICQPEPSNFESTVRRPGIQFLKACNLALGQSTPSKFEWRPLWRLALEDLYDSYDGICAYLGIKMEFSQGGVSVDHFEPKHTNPFRAFDWDNFRLTSSRMNSRKGRSQDVLDPFQIQNGWFEIDFTTGRVKANQDIDLQIQNQVKQTIKRLRLNDMRSKKQRIQFLDRWLAKKINLEVVKEDAPFIYMEILRQGFTTP